MFRIFYPKLQIRIVKFTPKKGHSAPLMASRTVITTSIVPSIESKTNWLLLPSTISVKCWISFIPRRIVLYKPTKQVVHHHHDHDHDHHHHHLFLFFNINTSCLLTKNKNKFFFITQYLFTYVSFRAVIFPLKREEMTFTALSMDTVGTMDSMSKEMLLAVSSAIISFCFSTSSVKLKLDSERKCRLQLKQSKSNT